MKRFISRSEYVSTYFKVFSESSKPNAYVKRSNGRRIDRRILQRQINGYIWLAPRSL